MFVSRTARMKRAIGQAAMIVIVIVVIIIIAGGAYAAVTLGKGSTTTTTTTTTTTALPTTSSSSAAQSTTGNSTTTTASTQNLTALAEAEGGTVTIYGVLDTAQWNQFVQPNLTEAYPFLHITYDGLGASQISSKAISECIANHVSSDLLIDTWSNLASVMQQTSGGKSCLQVWNNTAYEYSVGYNANNTDPTGYWHPGYTLPEILFYNTKLVNASDAPKSYSDLTNPKWKGDFVMQDPSVLGGVGTTFATLYGTMGNASWTSLMNNLKANNPVIISSNGVAYTDIESGQYPVGFGQLNDYISGINEAKTNSSFVNYVGATFPNPVVGAANVESIPAGCAHPYEAELITQWLTSPAGQAAYWASGRPPMNPVAFSQDLAGYIPSGVQVIPGGLDVPTFYTNPSYWSQLFVSIFGP
jgi:ABC-type Fe3+ transport system substrate-binding protein